MTSPPPPPAGERRAVPELRVGYVPGVTTTKWRGVWSERFARLALDLVEVAEADQRAAIDRQRVDMCFVRLPVPEDGLHLIPLYEEVPVVVTPKDHPVALYEEVSLADLSAEDVVTGFGVDDAMDLVAGGAGILFLPHSIARSRSRRDLVYRPVTDGTPTRIALAWLRENPHEMIEEFIGIVRGRTANSSRSTRTAPPVEPRPRPATARPKPAVTGRTRPPTRRPGRTRGR